MGRKSVEDYTACRICPTRVVGGVLQESGGVAFFFLWCTLWRLPHITGVGVANRLEGWIHSGNCPACGGPIFGRIRKDEPPVVTGPGVRQEVQEEFVPEGLRTCPKPCPYYWVA